MQNNNASADRIREKKKLFLAREQRIIARGREGADARGAEARPVAAVRRMLFFASKCPKCLRENRGTDA